MTGAKKRNFQYLIDQDGQQLLREKLPKHWVVREYRANYGLDHAVEVFKTVESAYGGHPNHDTLGEHFLCSSKVLMTLSYGR